MKIYKNLIRLMGFKHARVPPEQYKKNQLYTIFSFDEKIENK